MKHLVSMQVDRIGYSRSAVSARIAQLTPYASQNLQPHCNFESSRGLLRFWCDREKSSCVRPGDSSQSSVAFQSFQPGSSQLHRPAFPPSHASALRCTSGRYGHILRGERRGEPCKQSCLQSHVLTVTSVPQPT